MTETLPASMDDAELLLRYARGRDEAAFTQLVHRHQAMVLGAAVRRLGNPDLARDVAQQVFALLARKAGRLLHHDRLAGWLYQAAGYEAARLWKSEQRRQSRHAALADTAVMPPAGEGSWLALEEAMDALSPNDREALAMHYFQDLSYAEMAAGAALTEAAMRKRVSRALENLGARLRRRGARPSALALVTAAAAVQTTSAAPAGLAAGALALASTTSTAAQTLGWSQLLALMTTNTALKSAAVVSVMAALPLVWQAAENSSLRAEVARLEHTRPATVTAAAPASPGAASSADTRPRISSPAPDLPALQARISSLRQERVALEARATSLQAQVEKVQNEVVVSLGRVDEVAGKIARMQLLAMEMDRHKGNKEEQARLVPRLMDGLSEMMPLMAELRRLSNDPRLIARLTATSTAKTAGVSNAVRDEMERRLRRHYQQMNANGLALDRRPPTNHADWDRRYGEAAAAASRDIENLLPAAFRESEMWKSQTSADAAGHLSFLDMITAPDPVSAPASSGQPATKPRP